MFKAPFDWSSFWDLATPEEAAAMFREFYGPSAAQAAAQCASAAKKDDRDSDHRFWLAVSAVLGSAGPAVPSTPRPVQH
jgi:hypothetical protein